MRTVLEPAIRRIAATDAKENEQETSCPSAPHGAVRNYGEFPRLLERILIADEPQYAEL
jgi:hypothetical protein